MKQPILCLLTVLSAGPSWAQETQDTWHVVPFASLSGGVPAKAGTKAAGLFSNELKSTDKVVLAEVKKAPLSDAFSNTLEEARKHVDEAVKFRQAKKFRLAEEALQKALLGYKSAAAGLKDIAEFADAYVLLSAVQYNTGRDEEGLKSLQTALAMAPNRDVPVAQTSALFRQVMEDTRKKLLSAPKGSLLVESTPAGAPVLVDGLLLGSTPLLVREVPVGMHTFSITLPQGEIGGGIVEVLAQKQATASFKTTSVEPEVALQTKLAQNRIDTEAIEALKRIAAQTQSQKIVFGGLSKEGTGLRLDAFVFQAETLEVRRLPGALFDTELLSAGMEFYKICGPLLENPSLGEPVKAPASVNGGPATQPKVAEVKYVLSSGSVMVDGSEEKPLETPNRRIPLKKN